MEQQQDKVRLLDMGRFVHCAKGRSLPTLLSPVYLGLEGDVIHHEGSGDAPKDKAGTAAPGPVAEAMDSPPSGKSSLTIAAPPDGKRRQPPNTLSCTEMQSMAREGGRAGSIIAQAGPAGANHHVAHAQRLHLFQVLAPSLVARGRFFGSTLALKEEWEQLDAPYFSAPGEWVGTLALKEEWEQLEAPYFSAPGEREPGVPYLSGCCAPACLAGSLLGRLSSPKPSTPFLAP